MAASDSRPVPRKNVAFRLLLVLKDEAGDLVTDWSGASAAATISKDGGNFASTSNAPTEIQSSGTGYLDLTSTEMNADGVVVLVTATGAKDLVIAMYPEELGDYRVEKTGIVLDATALEAIDVADGINAREALNLILAALAGEVSGAGTNTITIKDAGDDLTTRIVAAVDGQGNRTAVTLTLPS
jgi:hypothetical protein